MIGDTMESLEDSDIEEEAEEEVNKVLFEVTDGTYLISFDQRFFSVEYTLTPSFCRSIGRGRRSWRSIGGISNSNIVLNHLNIFTQLIFLIETRTRTTGRG